MGAIAEVILAYAQPLLDQTDGSIEQLNKAMSIGMACYNLAMLPEGERDRVIGEMRQTLSMDDKEFEEFRQSIILPMIRRHEEMFPLLHRGGSSPFGPSSPSPSVPTKKAAPGEKYPGTDRYAPCPCGSGEKYKFCGGAKRR